MIPLSSLSHLKLRGITQFLKIPIGKQKRARVVLADYGTSFDVDDFQWLNLPQKAFPTLKELFALL